MFGDSQTAWATPSLNYDFSYLNDVPIHDDLDDDRGSMNKIDLDDIKEDERGTIGQPVTKNVLSVGITSNSSPWMQ